MKLGMEADIEIYFEATQVRLQLASQHFKSCRLSNSVCSNKAQNLTRPRDRQPAGGKISNAPKGAIFKPD